MIKKTERVNWWRWSGRCSSNWSLKSFCFCIDHKLVIAKLYSYSFDKNALVFVHSFLKGSQQITKLNSSYSAFAEILLGVPQGSILGPVLFSIYICDLFFENSDIDISNYTNGNTPYVCSSELDSVIGKIQKNNRRRKFFRLFHNNNLIPNAGFSHLRGHKFKHSFSDTLTR